MKKGVLINLTPNVRLRVEQLLECWNNLFILKQEFGNRPHWPTIEPKTVNTLGRFRTFLSMDYQRKGLIKFQIRNGAQSNYVILLPLVALIR